MLINEIKDYWATRSQGYSKVNKDELSCNQKQKWLEAIEKRIGNVDKKTCRILDVGTGPGFFAILLAEAGYNVTAIDLTEEMLKEAKENSKHLNDKTEFKAMNAEDLSFEDNTFDVLVTRNLTWNLENPEKAYNEWIRVLKKDGAMLNFDANWYCYINDEEKRSMYIEDRNRASKEEVEDFYEGTDIERMENIARKLPLSDTVRPTWDIDVMNKINVSKLTIEENIWEEVWSDEEKINYTTTPMFLVMANK